MLRPLKYLSFSLLVLMWSTAFSTHYLISETEEIFLYPAVAEVINSTDKTINATCEVRLAKAQQHGILVRVLNGSGVFNDIHLNTEDSRWMSFYQSKFIPVTLNPNTEVKITNYGEFPIMLHCTHS